MITVPAEALFDVLQKNEANFRDDYVQYIIKITDEDLYVIDELFSASFTPNEIRITKASFIQLLLNRVFTCSEYELKIGL